MSKIMSCTTPTSLQICPNLEALLQHDELTRRGSNSPTSPYHPISHASGFAVSLGPPPPRNTVRKVANHENRVKEIRRKKNNVRSDSWPDSLGPATNGPVGHSSPESSRSATTPNPYIKSTPVVPTINTFDARAAGPTSYLSPQNSHASSTETITSLAYRSEPDVYHTSDSPVHLIPSCRSSPTLHKVEKIFTKGRESLSILTSAAIPSSMKPKQEDHVDFRPHRTELVDSSAYQSSLSVPQVRHGRGSGYRAMSHQLSAFGDAETASNPNVFPLTTELRQFPPVRARSPFSTGTDTSANSPSISSTCSLSPKSGHSPSAGAISPNPSSTPHASSLPHLRPVSPIEMPLLLQKRASHDQQSFIDFFSPSFSVSQHVQDDPSIISTRRPSSPPILSSSIYSSTSRNSSLNDLPSMVFAPASPSSAANEVLDSPQHSRRSSSTSSHSDVSAMIFAPTSPTSGLYLSPISYRPGSPCSSATSLSTPEFATPTLTFPDTTDTLKPPIPTTAKPLFEKRGRKPRFQKRSFSSSPQPPLRLKVPLPPTTNTLDANERADLIRRNRKLAQLLGQTPAIETAASEVEESRLLKMLPQPPFSALLGSSKQKHHRHAMSVSVAVKAPGFKSEPSSSWQVIDYPSTQNGRRYSTPYTPRSFTFYLDDSPEPSATRDHHGSYRHRDPQHQHGSSTSFIDLSDEDNSNDASDAISLEMPDTANSRRIFHHSSSTPSVVEAFTPEEQAEAERRRKRDKLAKLHRFLGSRVPTDLVIGHIPGPSLPPSSMPVDGRDMWLYRRRSGSSAPSFERIKTELDDEEKAVNVRRAQKMEKLFGIPPPQTLYHTRQVPETVARSQPVSPVASLMTPTYVPANAPGFSRRNPNQSAYMKGKKLHRPGTSDSTTFLLPFKRSSSPEPAQTSDYAATLAQSSVYMNYQHSIASLTDIIERDDRASLAELHRFLHGDLVEVESPIEDQPLLESRRISSSSYSFKSERRLSLPTRTSMASSITTELPMASPRESSDFQLRRRRAAKLTHFFGVDYRELIHDILESIEKGVEEERKRGTLLPEEVESLLHKLHNLRTRQDGFC